MIWSIRFGKDVEALEAMQRAGKHVPALENRPDIVGLTWIWQAFWELSTCRAVGVLMGPIPWLAIHAYAQAHYLNPDEASLLHAAIRHMDVIWLEHHNEVARAKAKAGGRQQSPAQRRRGSRGRAR